MRGLVVVLLLSIIILGEATTLRGHKHHDNKSKSTHSQKTHKQPQTQANAEHTTLKKASERNLIQIQQETKQVTLMSGALDSQTFVSGALENVVSPAATPLDLNDGLQHVFFSASLADEQTLQSLDQGQVFFSGALGDLEADPLNTEIVVSATQVFIDSSFVVPRTMLVQISLPTDEQNMSTNEDPSQAVEATVSTADPVDVAIQQTEQQTIVEAPVSTVAPVVAAVVVPVEAAQDPAKLQAINTNYESENTKKSSKSDLTSQHKLKHSVNEQLYYKSFVEVEENQNLIELSETQLQGIDSDADAVPEWPTFNQVTSEENRVADQPTDLYAPSQLPEAAPEWPTFNQVTSEEIRVVDESTDLYASSQLPEGPNSVPQVEWQAPPPTNWERPVIPHVEAAPLTEAPHTEAPLTEAPHTEAPVQNTEVPKMAPVAIIPAPPMETVAGEHAEEKVNYNYPTMADLPQSEQKTFIQEEPTIQNQAPMDEYFEQLDGQPAHYAKYGGDEYLVEPELVKGVDVDHPDRTMSSGTEHLVKAEQDKHQD